MNEILTGHEIYVDGEIDIDKSIRSIQDAMCQRNPEKYGNFLETLDKTRNALYGMYHPTQYLRSVFAQKIKDIKVFSNPPLHTKIKEDPIIELRLELFRCIYYAMRLIDDIVDGDTIPPLPLKKRLKLIESILLGDIDTIKNPLYKALAVRISELSEKLGKKDEIQTALEQIIISIKFDLDRIMDEKKIRSKEELQENFHKMDIVGTIVATAIIFGIKTDSIIQLIEPLGESCRVMYNLRDFGEDIYADLINIPEEELSKFDITRQDLELVKTEGRDIKFLDLPTSIKEWFKNEVEKVVKLMIEHEENMKTPCDFEDNPNSISKAWRNFVIKKKVFPAAYETEIQTRIPQILAEVS